MPGERCENKQVLVKKHSPVATESLIAPTGTPDTPVSSSVPQSVQFKECALTYRNPVEAYVEKVTKNDPDLVVTDKKE